jgi:hypothetical protein
MSTTQIADIYNPLVFARQIAEKQINLNAFIASGIMSNDATLASMGSVGGNVGEITHYTPMVNSEPNYSTDNPATIAGTDKVDSAALKYRKYYGNRGWSFMALAGMINLQQGMDPVQAMTSQLAQYWANVNQTRVIRSALGVLADSVANHSSDMLKSVATDAAAAVTDAERISADVVLGAKQTLGDHASKLNAIAMHSVVKTRLQLQNLIVDIPDARGEIMIPTYLGYRVIEDDEMPAVAGTNRITYTCILFAAGSFGYADVPTEMPSEMERVSGAGNGSGENRIWSRNSGIIQPMGYSSVGAPAGQSLTWAELQLAGTWTRVWSRKNVPMAFIQVND